MRSWSPSYFVRWCALWVVYVGLRALLLSPSLEAFCDLLTWGTRSHTRALIAWAGMRTTPSGWSSIFFIEGLLSLCLFPSFFCTWLNNWSNHLAVAWTDSLFVYCRISVSTCYFSMSLSYSFWNASCISVLLSVHLSPVQCGGAVCYCDHHPSTPPHLLCCLWNTVIDKCAWLRSLPAFSSFARHFVAFNHAFNCHWRSRWMAVEQEMSGILFLFLWVYTIEQELFLISRSNEDLTVLVVLACSSWAWSWKCVFVYFGSRPVLLCGDSICCHYCSGSTWHLKWPAPNGSLSRSVCFLLFLRESTGSELLYQINMHESCAVLLTHIHACKTQLSSVTQKNSLCVVQDTSKLIQAGKKPNKATMISKASSL